MGIQSLVPFGGLCLRMLRSGTCYSWKYEKIVRCLLRIGSVLKWHLIIVSTCYKIDKTVLLFNLTLHGTEILEE